MDPARGNTSTTSRRASAADQPQTGWRRFAHALGPGLVTGASDDDPSGIATFAQAGAQFRNGALWTVVLSLPLMMAVQEICDRTALATGESLGALARRKYSRRGRVVVLLLLSALLVANTLNVAADLMAVGQGMNLLHAGPAALWSGIGGGLIIVLLVTGSFSRIAQVFKFLCVSLLAYVAVLFTANVDWGDVVKGLIGWQLNSEKDYWVIIVAILGTTISPYLFFWQSGHRVEEMRGDDTAEGAPLRAESRGQRRHRLQEARVDVFSGMFFSQLVMFAIIVATAATLGRKGSVNIGTAADAAQALRPIAGNLASLLFAAGFIGSGLLAVPVLAGSASIGLAGLLDKDWGFEESPRKAPVFYGLVAAGTLGGIVLSVVLSHPMHLLVLAALVNGVAAAPFLIVVMLISDDRQIMGKERNGALARTLGWGTTVVMTLAGVAGVWQALTPG